MAVFDVKINSLETSYFGDNKNYKAIKVVPSMLMRTTSQDFAREKQVTSPTAVYDLNIEINGDDSSILDIKKLEGHFESNAGKHYIKLLETMSLDMSNLDDNENYNIAVEITFNEADTERADYPFTELKMNVEKTSDNINGVILATFHFESDEISDLVLKDIVTTYQSAFLNYLSSECFILANSDIDRPLMGATYGCDTSNNSFNITLPASPAVGDYFLVEDIKGTFNNNSVTLLRNGKTIMGNTEDYELDISNNEYKIRYVGNDDWRVI